MRLFKDKAQRCPAGATQNLRNRGGWNCPMSVGRGYWKGQ